MKTGIAFSRLALLLPTWSARAVAEDKNGVEIRAVAEVEVKVKDDDGKEQVKRVPAKKVPPGDAVIYTLHAENKGASPPTTSSSPIRSPSTWTTSTARRATQGTELTFSADGGKTWAAKEKLQVTRQGRSDCAPPTPDEITHIRWQFEKPLAPGESRAVEFRARVE